MISSFLNYESQTVGKQTIYNKSIKDYCCKNITRVIMIIILPLITFLTAQAQSYNKGNLLYSNSFSDKEEMINWKMEGPGTTAFENGWMHLYSRNEKGHHVYWCPYDFPNNFIAEWEVQNQETDAGLCIIFFAALGLNGGDIFDPSLSSRDGDFNDYIKGNMNNYHISYYANGKDDPGREIANLRKNKGFHKVQSDHPGIPLHSTAIHKVQLIKQAGNITMYIDEREIINWTDDGLQYGKVLAGGKIGFRQMKWTHFAYRNFKVWECLPLK